VNYRLPTYDDIGQECEFSDDWLFGEVVKGQLAGAPKYGTYETKGSSWYYCRVPIKPKAPYVERQKAWVEEHKIVPGSKVRVLRVANDREDDWGDSWVHFMNDFVGKECTVVREPKGKSGVHIKHNNNIYNFPYFVLEPVKPTYREPTLADCGKVVEFSDSPNFEVSTTEVLYGVRRKSSDIGYPFLADRTVYKYARIQEGQ
jgi:hypothetical protein